MGILYAGVPMVGLIVILGVVMRNWNELISYRTNYIEHESLIMQPRNSLYQ